MGKVIIVLVVVAAIALVVVGGIVAWVNSPAVQTSITQRAASDAAKAAADLQAQQQHAALDLQAQQDDAAWRRQFRDALTPLAWLALAGLALCVGLGVPAALGIALASQWDTRQTERGRVKPKQGQFSVSPAHADQAGLISATGYWQAQIEGEKRPAFSGSARNERITVTNGHAAPALPNRPAVELPAPSQALPGPVALSHVLTWQPDLTRVLIGLDPAGRPLTVSARELCHVALVGATGGGKSNAMRLLLGQLLAAGARAVLIDPHFCAVDPDDQVAGDWRAIEHKLYRPPAVLPAEMAATFDWLSQELDERLARRRHGERSGPPLFVAIDELPSIASKVDTAPDTLTSIVREGRKVGLLAITSSQDFLVKSIGTGSAARDNFRTCVYAGGDQVSARVLLDVKARDIPEAELGRGVVMLRSQATPTAGLARLPLVTDQDLARLLPAPAGVVVEPAPPRRSLVDMAYPQAHRTDPDGLGRSDGGNEPQNGPTTPEPTDRPRPTATDRPPLRVLKPQNLVDKAIALGIELAESDWRDLAVLDSGQSPQAIAARETGTTEGRPYRRRRDELMRLADMVRNWPEDDQAQTAEGGC